MTARSNTPCRALVGGFGRPGMRDLDFGRQVIECLQQYEWPDEVVVEDLSYSAPLVLNRLRELRPAKVVLVGAVARDFDPPATLRRYHVDLTPAGPEETHRSIEESVMGMVDLDHTLTIARHWGGLPADTVVIEVEPAEAEFGLGFSDQLAECLDPILDMVREELAGVAEPGPKNPFDGEPAVETAVETSEDLSELVTYAGNHAQACLQRHRPPRDVPAVRGVAVAGSVHPWGVFIDRGGDWFDAVHLAGGALGIVVGDVLGRGVAAAAAMSDLRAVAQAYAVLDGASPGRLVRHLDDLARATGMGRGTRLLYLTVQPTTGEVRYASAGACPPLVVDGEAQGAHYAWGATGAALGLGGVRAEATMRLPVGACLLLFTDGLVESRAVPRQVGLEHLRVAAGEGPRAPEALCRHVLGACTARLRRDDDICIVGVSLTGVGVTVPSSARHHV